MAFQLQIPSIIKFLARFYIDTCQFGPDCKCTYSYVCDLLCSLSLSLSVSPHTYRPCISDAVERQGIYHRVVDNLQFMLDSWLPRDHQVIIALPSLYLNLSYLLMSLHHTDNQDTGTAVELAVVPDHHN